MAYLFFFFLQKGVKLPIIRQITQIYDLKKKKELNFVNFMF